MVIVGDIINPLAGLSPARVVADREMANDVVNMFPAEPLPLETTSETSQALGGVNYYHPVEQLDDPPYFTGAQTFVLIGSTVVLQASGIQYNANYEHSPYHGYRSEYYDWVFRGRGIVQGTMALNLMDTHLLDLIIGRAYAPTQTPSTADELRKINEAEGHSAALLYLDSVILKMTREGRNEEIASMLDEVQVGMMEPPSPTTQDTGESAGFGGRLSEPPSRTALRTLRWLQDQQRFGIDLRIHYGDPMEIGRRWGDRRYSTAEVLKGVIFTGINSVNYSANTAYWTYSFFARNVEPL